MLSPSSLFLYLSFFRSFILSLSRVRVFRHQERSIRPQIHLRFLIPTYYESWSALFDARTFSDTVRCIRFDPLYF